MMSKKHKKVCTTLNYFEHFLTLASTIRKSKLSRIEVLISKALVDLNIVMANLC